MKCEIYYLKVCDRDCGEKTKQRSLHGYGYSEKNVRNDNTHFFSSLNDQRFEKP